MLILAGVSINLVLSNNGVISKAKDAKEKHLQAQENDTSYLNDVSDWIEQEVSDNGPFSKYKVGDYVDYKPALETEIDETKKTYSLTTDKSGVEGEPQTVAYESGLKWRILNINEDTGKIDIVADPTTAGVKLCGATGYNNGVYALNDICEQLYSNKVKGITARNINLADMEKNLTPDGFNERNKFKYAFSPKYGGTKTYTGGYYYPNSYKNEIGSGVEITENKANTIIQPDIINTVDPYKGSIYSKTLTNGYTKASTAVTATETGYVILINPTNYGEASSVLYNSNLYWIASRVVVADSNICFGLCCLKEVSNEQGLYRLYMGDQTLFFSYLNQIMSESLCLRPLVSLDASILTEKTGDTWSVNL